VTGSFIPQTFTAEKTLRCSGNNTPIRQSSLVIATEQSILMRVSVRAYVRIFAQVTEELKTFTAVLCKHISLRYHVL